MVALLAAAAVVLWVGSLRGGGAAQSALAVLALALIAAALATGGWARRLLGALCAGVGVLAPLAALGQGVLPTVLGATAGLAMAVSGALLLLRGHRMPRMGARYQAKPGRRSAWDELDAGNDPTA